MEVLERNVITAWLKILEVAVFNLPKLLVKLWIQTRSSFFLNRYQYLEDHSTSASTNHYNCDLPESKIQTARQ
jgi:hypothetical protein